MQETRGAEARDLVRRKGLRRFVRGGDVVGGRRARRGDVEAGMFTLVPPVLGQVLTPDRNKRRCTGRRTDRTGRHSEQTPSDRRSKIRFDIICTTCQAPTGSFWRVNAPFRLDMRQWIDTSWPVGQLSRHCPGSRGRCSGLKKALPRVIGQDDGWAFTLLPHFVGQMAKWTHQNE